LHTTFIISFFGGALGAEWMKVPWSRRDPWKGVEASV